MNTPDASLATPFGTLSDEDFSPFSDASHDEAGVEDVEAAERAQRLRGVVEWAVVLVSAFLVALLLKAFLVQAFYIPSGSMQPTLVEGDRILVNKLSYELHDVNRGDLVVFARPAAARANPGDADDLIKRVVGEPGDVLVIENDRLVVNGRVLDEPYLEPNVITTAQTYLAEPYEVPEGHVFVMGDNRTASYDARFFGAVPIDSIVGRAFVRVWPLTEMRFF